MAMSHDSDVKYLFEPRSAAVIGASANPGKIGYKLMENIVAKKFPGKIYPVNPSGGEILGVPVCKTVEDIDGDIDLATICIPAKHTFAAVQELAKRNTKFVSIITSGFSEVGKLEEERKIVRFAREHGMRVLGPNIFGIYSSMASINATFGPKDVKAGNVAIITQSGALGIAMMGKAITENIGLSAIVSLGNKADIDEADLLDYLVAHDGTGIILMYIEGIKHGERLVGLLREATKKKPIIVIKSGRSRRGAIAAASHTGSLAGADEIFSDIMKQCGVMRVESLAEGLNWCKFLSRAPVPGGENTVIITNGGGMGVMAADACEKYNVSLYDDTQAMKDIFSPVVPEFGSTKNPIDITGGAPIEDYGLAINAAMENDRIHSIICLGCQTAVFNADVLPEMIMQFFPGKKSKKPIVFSYFGGAKIDKCIMSLRKKDIPIFFDVYEAVSCLGALYSSHRTISNPPDTPLAAPEMDAAAIESLIAAVRTDNRKFLLANESSLLMKAAGIAMPQSFVARNMDEAVSYAERIGYPVVMKVVSKQIVHKSDCGGVALDLENREEVIDAFGAIMRNCHAHEPRAYIEGMEVAEMIKGGGTETIIGARADTSFGPIVMFGLGGIYVEVMKDVCFRAFPLGRKEILNLVGGIRSYPLLLGVRGEAKKDINGIADTILKVGTILDRFRDISDIEVNPLIVYDEGKGVKALDARILLS